MSKGRYQRVPSDELPQGEPVPLFVRVPLALLVVAGTAYYWPVLNSTNRFLVVTFSIIMWAVLSTGAWNQDARKYRKKTDALQRQEMRKAWSTFKEAAVGEDAIPINKLGGGATVRQTTRRVTPVTA